jgi:hypothetical protein
MRMASRSSGRRNEEQITFASAWGDLGGGPCTGSKTRRLPHHLHNSDATSAHCLTCDSTNKCPPHRDDCKNLISEFSISDAGCARTRRRQARCAPTIRSGKMGTAIWTCLTAAQHGVCPDIWLLFTSRPDHFVGNLRPLPMRTKSRTGDSPR